MVIVSSYRLFRFTCLVWKLKRLGLKTNAIFHSLSSEDKVFVLIILRASAVTNKKVVHICSDSIFIFTRISVCMYVFSLLSQLRLNCDVFKCRSIINVLQILELYNKINVEEGLIPKLALKKVFAWSHYATRGI